MVPSVHRTPATPSAPLVADAADNDPPPVVTPKVTAVPATGFPPPSVTWTAMLSDVATTIPDATSRCLTSFAAGPGTIVSDSGADATDPAVAVMDAPPARSAWTDPLEETVARVGSEDDHATVVFITFPFWSFTVA